MAHEKGEKWNLILEYVQQRKQFTIEEVTQAFEGICTAKDASNYILRMKDAGLVQRTRYGVYVAVDEVPKNDRSAIGRQPKIEANGHPNGNQSGVSVDEHESKIELSLADKQRPSFRVEIYTAPIVEDKVKSIQVRYEGMSQWTKLPLWGGIMLCLGPDDPGWEQEWSNRGICAIRIVRADGSTRDFSNLNPGNTVAIAPIAD